MHQRKERDLDTGKVPEESICQSQGNLASAWPDSQEEPILVLIAFF